MTAALADTLDRAAAFLRALPEGVPEPVSNFETMAGNSIFIRWRNADDSERSMTVLLSVRETDIIYCAVMGKEDPAKAVSVPFDGATVPPAIVAAILRVCG